MRTYGALEDWERVVALLPKISGLRLDTAQIGEPAAAALRHFAARPDIDAADIESLWARLPCALRRRPALIATHAEGLSRLDRGDAAEKMLRQALKSEWNETLVLAYGTVVSSSPSRQLKRAEKWLKVHAEDAALLLTAARLCMAVELWGKARSYLESSIAIDPRPAAYALYGQLLKELGEEDDAAVAFRSGLALVTRSAADLPALGAPRATRDDDQASAAANDATEATR